MLEVQVSLGRKGPLEVLLEKERREPKDQEEKLAEKEILVHQVALVQQVIEESLDHPEFQVLMVSLVAKVILVLLVKQVTGESLELKVTEDQEEHLELEDPLACQDKMV